jgi:hypothetical protein
MLVAAAENPASRAAPQDEQMHLTLDVAPSQRVPDLDIFLAERVADTWGGEALAASDDQSRFRVGVSWLAERSAEVAVDEGDVRLAQRILVITDPGAAKLTIWLLVKSTIRRALVSARPAAPPIEPPARAAVTVSASAPAAPEPLSFATLIVFSLGQPDLFSVGPGFGIEWSPWPRVSLGGELGYRVAPGVIGLLIHHIPVRANVGWSVGPDRAVTLGVAATADIKVPVAEDRHTAALGVETGGFVALRLPLAWPEVSFLLRGTVAVRPVRQRYVLDGDVVAEALWDASVSTGVSW